MVIQQQMGQDERTELLRQIRDEIVGLSSSPLYQERVNTGAYAVIGEGNHHANIMFIGEAPGRNEAETGRPFCGVAGKILDELLASAGIKRKDVYVTNILKDRPPMNRDPLPKEIEIYGPFLDRQIKIIQPGVIVTLGRFAMAYIMNKFKLGWLLKPISQIHGKIFNAKTPYGDVRIIPLYHPAVAVYKEDMKAMLMQDFQVLAQFAS